MTITAPEVEGEAFEQSSPSPTIFDRLYPAMPYLIPLGLFLLGIILYVNTTDGWIFFSWDDNRYISENQLIRDFGPDKLWQIFTEPYFAAYIPMTIFSYAIEFSLWGMDPTGYHVTNIVLHALNGMMVYYFLRQLHPRQAVALIAAILFLIHPVQVENVAWISQRKSLLSMFFFLLTCLTHAKSAKHPSQPLWIGLAWFWFLLAILAKPTAVLAGFLYIYYDYFWGQLPLRTVAWRNLPYLIIGAIGSVLIVLAHKEYGGIKEAPGGTIGRSILLMIWVTGDYAASVLAPLNLNPLYIYPTMTVSLTNPFVWFGIFVLAWLGIVAWLQPFGKPLSAFAILWIVLMMLPVSNIIPIAIQRADRYMYYPSIVIFALIGVAAVKVWEWSAANIQWRTVVMLNGAFLLGLLLFLTFQQNKIWHNEDTLWAANLEVYPTSETGLLNRGVHFYRIQDFDTATVLFSRLVALYPNHYKGNRFLGIIAFREQRYPDAAYYLRRTIQLSPNDDTRDELGRSLIELGVVAHDSGDYDQALRMYEEAAQYVPNEPILYNNIGFTYYRQNNTEAALANFKKATDLKPDYVRAWLNTGLVARQTGQNTLAIQAYESVLALGETLGGESSVNYCVALTETGVPAESALPYCRAGIEAEPGNALYMGLTAHVLLIYGDAEQALAMATNAITANPNLSLGYRCIGDAQLLLGNTEAALNAYNQALALDPNNQRALQGVAQLTGQTP